MSAFDGPFAEDGTATVYTGAAQPPLHFLFSDSNGVIGQPPMMSGTLVVFDPADPASPLVTRTGTIQTVGGAAVALVFPQQAASDLDDLLPEGVNARDLKYSILTNAAPLVTEADYRVRRGPTLS